MPKHKRKKTPPSDESDSESEIPDSSPSKRVHIDPAKSPSAEEAIAEVQRSSPTKRKNRSRTLDAAVPELSSPTKPRLQTGGEESPRSRKSRSKETHVQTAGSRSEAEAFKTPDRKIRWPEGTPKTPNTPFSAQEYGIISQTAKQVVKSGSRFDSLMELLIYWGNIILTRGSVPEVSDLGEAIEELGRLLSNVKSAKFTYSGLTSEHMQKMLKANNVNTRGIIEVQSIAALLQDIKIPNSFHEQLQIFSETNVRTIEAGCRAIIGLYLNNAVKLSKELGARNVAVFAEVPCAHPNLPGVGPISGALDFLVSTVSEKINIAKFGDRAFPEVPRFVVIEAKQTATFGQKASYAQIWAQLLTVNFLDRPDGLAGVLTDGYRFDFFYLKPKSHQSRRRKSVVETEEELELYESAAIYATDKSSIDHIMGLLTRFSRGYTPELDSSIRFIENT